MSAQAKPHIYFHDGYWWVCPWRGSNYGVAALCLGDAWKRWGWFKGHMLPLMAKEKQEC